jgi:hypothetical protein
MTMELPFAVGLSGEHPILLRRFASEDEASRFISTLEGAEDGIYYLDGPERVTEPAQTQVWTVTLPDDSAVDVTIANLYDDEMRLRRILELAGLDAYCTYR